MRVAVIGSGVLGACVSWHLARGGADVLMLDAGQPGEGVTRWTFSWLNAHNKTEPPEYFDLNVAGMAEWGELSRRVEGDWWHPSGHLRWATEAEEVAAIRDTVARLRERGYPAELIDVETARRLEPNVRFDDDASEVGLFADEGWLDGPDLVSRLVDDAIAHGARGHFGDAVVEIATDGGGVTGVVLAGGGRHPAEVVVNAAGPAARDVAALVGRRLPMLDQPGLIARVSCDGAPIRRLLHAPDVAMRPDGAGRVVLHSRAVDETLGLQVDPGEEAQRLHERAARVVPALEGSSIGEARVAWRPIAADGFPSVGGVDGIGGYFEAVSHSGITLGAFLGRAVADEILEGTVDSLVAPYRPGRFG